MKWSDLCNWQTQKEWFNLMQISPKEAKYFAQLRENK